MTISVNFLKTISWYTDTLNNVEVKSGLLHLKHPENYFSGSFWFQLRDTQAGLLNSVICTKCKVTMTETMSRQNGKF